MHSTALKRVRRKTWSAHASRLLAGALLVTIALSCRDKIPTAPSDTSTTAVALAFQQQPSVSVADGRVKLAVVVAALRADGSVDRNFHGVIAVALDPHPTGGALARATHVAAVNGVASFDDLQLSAIGTGRTIVAESPSLDPVHSDPFDAGGGLAFATPPVTSVLGIPMKPVTVVARDLAGLQVASFSAPVTLSLAPGSSAALSGTLTATPADGIATFADLRLSAAVTSSHLVAAASGASNITSGPFGAYPALFAISMPFSAVFHDTPLPTLAIAVTDSGGVVQPRGNVDVTVSLAPGGPTGTLSGTTTVRTVNGIASFSNLAVHGVGVYRLNAVIPVCCAAPFTSAPFEVTSGSLVFTTQPSPSVSPHAFAPAVQVTVKDTLGNTDLSFNGPISLELVTTGPGVIRGAVANAVNGVATFPDASVDIPDTAYRLRARSSKALTGVSSSFAVTSPWTARPPMPTARWGASLAEVGGRLYAFGPTNVDVYDPVTTTWTTRAAMPTARRRPVVAVLDGVVYVVSGEAAIGEAFNVEAYDPVTNSWSIAAPLAGRYHVTVAALGGLLYAIGTSDPSFGAGMATFDVYDPRTNTWTPRTPLSARWSGVALAPKDGLLYAIGGYNGYELNPNVYFYDPRSNLWTLYDVAPTGRMDATIVVVGDSFYVIGGDGSLSAPSTVDIYTPGTRTWAMGPALPRRAYRRGGAALGGTIYVSGGANDQGGAEVRSEVLSFTP